MRPLMNQVECHLKERQYWKSDGDQHAAQIMKEAVRNLERVDRNKSFFMWIDCFDPHEPVGCSLRVRSGSEVPL